MDYKDLTEDQKAKVRACKTPEELHALARKEGVELSLEELDGVAGGWGCSNDSCPEDCQFQSCGTYMC